MLIASGDSPAKVGSVAERLGVSIWRARQLPAEKVAWLAELRASGAHVLVVGDGVNDAPVLAGADVAIALAEGAELAQASSDIVLTTGRPDAIAPARSLAQHTLAVVRQNQRWFTLLQRRCGAAGRVGPGCPLVGGLGDVALLAGCHPECVAYRPRQPWEQDRGARETQRRDHQRARSRVTLLVPRTARSTTLICPRRRPCQFRQCTAEESISRLPGTPHRPYGGRKDMNARDNTIAHSEEDWSESV